jgi:hypothetical protein
MESTVISGGSCRDFLLLHPLEEEESVVIFGKCMLFLMILVVQKFRKNGIFLRFLLCEISGQTAFLCR